MQRMIDLDKKRKRFFFVLCASIICVAFVFLSVLNYLEGDMLELIIDSVILLIMCASLVALKKSDADMMIYLVAHLLICALLFFTVAHGSGGGTVLYLSLIHI